MKRLIVCCDGTWNNPEQEDNGIAAPTNVFKIYNAVAEHDSDNVQQLKYYHPGVGGEDSGIVDSVLGGVVGAGMDRHISSAYHWLGNNYEEGDEIYLFGFSRGAFTVRSLSGMLSRGLLDLRKVKSDASWVRVKKVYEEGYRKKAARGKWSEPDWLFFNSSNVKLPIHFIGVWDTVGALGVPDDLEIFNLFDNKEKWQFHNTSLGANVKCARHAMAIDEVRSSFSITRWENAERHKNAKEVWFPGVHSDVGGGYADCGLSNGALKWMMEESGKVDNKPGIRYREEVAESIKEDALGPLHNSYKGVFAKLRSRPRKMAAMVLENNEFFHASAVRRQSFSPIEHSAYRPTRVLKAGESYTVDVFAGTRWNDTSVYLEAGGKYIFSATGKWQDSKDSCGWKGTEDGKLTTGDVIRATSSFLGTFETIFKKLTKNESTDFLGTKRVESMPWFTLVGAIANDSGIDKAVTNDGSAKPHQYAQLADYTKSAKPLLVSDPGYLYCFPNDVWSLYDNNSGSVQLTIKRVS